jgi:hypothetical protein
LALALPIAILGGPVEDFASIFLPNLVHWLMVLIIPVYLVIWWQRYRNHLLYRKLAKSLGV